MIWGVYAHVPWCRVRCPYCAFEIVPTDAPTPGDAWADAVLRDLDAWRPAFPGEPSTLYFGGGTPSRLAPSALARIVDAVGAPDVSAEANPEDVDDRWLDGAIAAGITRLSLGVQTLDPALSRVVGRAHHDPRPALERIARAPLRSWSVDLMFGLPGQTLDALDADLDALIASGAPHVSLYGLTIEPGTGFARLDARRPGGLGVPDDDVWRAMFDRIGDRLERAGIFRYEVSNFARPGHESAHNRLYWQGAPYLGVGPGAHGFAPDGRRWVMPALPTWWTDPTPRVELPSERERASDRLVCALRGRDGVALDALGRWRPSARVVRQLVFAGLLDASGARLALTRAGYPVADAVVRALVHGLEEVGAPTG